MRPGGRHTIVCRHWLRDLCMKGDKCDFLHQYDLARMPECVQWSRFGKCPDNDCDFRHDTEKMECQKYKFGFCKLGSQCRMRHDKLSRAYLPEAVPDWFLKEICPNFFDFVPALPEEAVRATGREDQALQQAQQPAMSHLGIQSWQPAVPQPVIGTDSNWAAPTLPTWNMPAASRHHQNSGWSASAKPVVDLTEDKPSRSHRGRREPPPQAAPERRPDAREARDSRRTSPDRGDGRHRKEEERARERRDEDRHRDERTRDRREDIRGRDRFERDRSRQRYEDERSRREDDRRGDRRRSRSYDRKRDDRPRSRR